MTGSSGNPLLASYAAWKNRTWRPLWSWQEARLIDRFARALVRGALFLRKGHGTLLDVAGRPVQRFGPGRNDVSGLAPGVYFLLEQGTGQSPEPRIVVR